MCSESSLRERFWRDVAAAIGHSRGDPSAIQEAVEDMMHNYGLDEVPGFEAASESEAAVPDTTNFARHSPFAPVFRIASRALSSLGCFGIARPIFVGPRGVLRRRRSQPEPRNPNHFPGGRNPGIQAGADQPTHPTPAVHGAFHSHHTPSLPPWTPQHFVWAFPTGHLAWSPHPQSSPFPPPFLPGTMPQWTPNLWPPLNWAHQIPIRLSPYIIPNPNNPDLPFIDWDISKHPSTAKRLTPNHVVVDIGSLWGEALTHTNAHSVVVTCDVGHASTLWGPIAIRQSENNPVTLRDLFDAIYQHFQVPLTYPEVQYICNLHPSNYDRLADAYHERCRESVALPGWEARQGFRRIDVLGDQKHWWGVWISSCNGAWWLSLGLVSPSYRIPPR